MTTTHCFVPILGKRIRVTQVTDAGVIPTGAMQITTDGFITVSLTSDIEAGTEIIQRNAHGQLCVNEKMNSSFKRFEATIDFCGVNPSLLAYVANAKEYHDYAGDVSGFTVGEGELTGSFALELWTGIGGALTDPTANGYFLLPFIGKGVLGDIKIDGTNAVTFSIKSAATKGGNGWGIGPYNVLINQAGTNDVQTVTITGAPTGGTFKLTLDGQSTTVLSYAALASDVQAALVALPNIGAGDVTVTDGPGPSTPYVVTFVAALAQRLVDPMTAAPSFTGGTTPAITVVVTAVGAPGVPAKLPTAMDPYNHLLLIDSGVAPPVSACAPTLVSAVV
jgi:hypothetical protein